MSYWYPSSMPHMAPFVWLMAPAMILTSVYVIYMMQPTPLIYVAPSIPTSKELTWNWR